MRFCSQKWSSNRAAKMSWWRSVVDKTTRLQYDTSCIGYTQHQYPRRHLKIQRKHSIQNRLTCCFASQNFLTDSFCPQHYVTGWNWTIKLVLASRPFFDKNSVVFCAKNLAKFLFRRTLTFTIDLFTYWTVKLCQEKIHFICTLTTGLTRVYVNNFFSSRKAIFSFSYYSIANHRYILTF